MGREDGGGFELLYGIGMGIERAEWLDGYDTHSCIFFTGLFALSQILYAELPYLLP